MGTASTPSEIVRSPVTIKDAVEHPSGPRCGRPFDCFGPPPALFSAELALLKYDLDHLETITPNSTDAERAFNLIEHAGKKNGDRSEREMVLQFALERLLVGKSQWQVPISDGSATPHGVWLEGSLAYLLVEMKDEPGPWGDPLLQGLVTCGKILAQDKVPFPLRSLHFTEMIPNSIAHSSSCRTYLLSCSL